MTAQKVISLLFVLICFSSISHAKSSKKDERIGESSTYSIQSNGNLSAAEVYLRTQAVLNYYGVPAEAESAPYLEDLFSTQSSQKIQNVLPFLDPLKIFSKFSNLSAQELTTFLDFDSKSLVDVKAPLVANFQLAPANESVAPLSFPNGRTIGADPALPLKGLRVALDPGHMGGKFWDELTGKFVRDRSGRIVSEGVIALQTCILLRAELQRLGAEVMLTHEGFAPITALEYSSFDLKPFALNELRDSIHLPWFQSLLSSSGVGPSLYQAFDKSSARQKLFSNSSRDDYFIKRADLWARADAINAFQPDLVLIVHFDTDEPPGNSTGLNAKAPSATKAFVVGGYQRGEFGSREARKYFTRHILDANSWEQSLNLSRSIVNQFHQQLNMKLPTSADDETYMVEPGIFSRNLVIPRRLRAPVISYLECLFYNRPDEFEAFLKTTHPMQINGQNVLYSDRVVQVANSIRDGVLDYTRHLVSH